MKNVGSKAKQGLMWSALFNIIQQILRFGGSIVLARLLFPEDFGLIGIAMIVTKLARRFTNFGLTTIVIQRKDIHREHLDTVFLFNLTIMSLTTVVLFIGAPVIAEFFRNQQVGPVLQAISVIFVLQAISGISGAILTREMRYKELGLSQTFERIAVSIVPIVLALMGFGVWSIVGGILLGSLALMVSQLYYAPWWPKFRFSRAAFREVFSFGLWMYIGNFIRYGINNVDFFVIGKFLSATQLGYYERAFSFINMPKKNFIRRINSVLFSAYSRMQEDNERLCNAMVRVTTSIAVVVFPFMVWLFFAAPAIITILYGEKWTPTIYPLQVMCIAGVINTLGMIFYPVLIAKGLVSQNARYNFLYFLVLTTAVLVGLRWGINGVAWGSACATLVFLGTNLYLTHRFMGFPISQFFRALRSIVIYSAIEASVLAGIYIFGQAYFPRESLSMLILLTLAAVVSYVGAHLIFRFTDVREIFADLGDEVRKFTRKVFPFLHKRGSETGAWANISSGETTPDFIVHLITVPHRKSLNREAVLARWLKKDGEPVKPNDPVCQIQADGDLVAVVAEHGGVLRCKMREGERIRVGDVLGEIVPSSLSGMAGA